MFSTRKISLVMASFSLLSSATLAAEQDAIIVTATRTAQIADQSLSPVIIITREELEKETGSELTDILHRYPGIDVSRNGGAGQQSSIFIRGAESDHTLIMIDGITINPGTIGTASIQNIPVEMIEQIEIVKGARSTLYGSDAIGGVINIITRKQEQKGSYYQAGIGAGSFATKTASFSAHNNTGDKAAGINITAKQSDGFSTISNSTLERGYDNLSINLYGSKRIGETDLRVEHFQTDGTVEYFDYPAVPVDQDSMTSVTSVSIDNNPTTGWASKIKLSYFDDDIEQNQSDDFTRTQRTSIDWQNDIQLNESQLLTTGLYISDEDTSSLSYGTGFEANTSINAIFFQDNITLDSHHILLGARYTDHEAYGEHTTWNLEYGYQLNKQWQLIAAANTGFRSPSSTDLYGYGGNPDLKPEESENTELGIRYKKGSHKFSLNAFDNKIDKLIIYYDPDGWSGPILGSNQNINESRIKGVEAGYQYISDNWLVSLNAIDQDPRNLNDNSLLLRRAEQKYSLSVSYNSNDYGLQLDITNVSERADVAATVLEPYTLVGIKGNYMFNKSLSATARIENASDEDYQLADGYNTPERSYYLKLDYIF